MESNKFFAAILVAGILAMLSGFVAKKVVFVEKPEENAFKIAALDDSGAGGESAPAGPEPVLGLLATADATKGQNTAKACGACHTFNKGEPFKVGPNLYGIIGNHHAHMEGFAYSDAMQALHDKTWNYAELNVFLFNPKAHIPGTKMVFAGLKKVQDRANVIAFLRSLADAPQALPSDSDIKAEAAALAPAGAAAPADAAAKEKADAKKTDDKKADDKKTDEKKSDEKSDAKKDDAKAAAEPAPAQ